MRPHTPGPWEARLYEPESAEYEDGFRAWIANHRQHVFVADVLEVRNAAPIAAVPDMVALLEEVHALMQRSDIGRDLYHALGVAAPHGEPIGRRIEELLERVHPPGSLSLGAVE